MKKLAQPTESPRKTTVRLFSQKLIPRFRRIGAGKFVTLPFPARRSPWHDSAPRVWIGVPPPPGLAGPVLFWLALLGAGLEGGGGGAEGGGPCSIFCGWRCPPDPSAPAVNNA